MRRRGSDRPDGRAGRAARAPEPDPDHAGEEVDDRRVRQRHARNALPSFEEPERDGEREQSRTRSSVRARAACAIDEPEQEYGAEPEPHVGRLIDFPPRLRRTPGPSSRRLRAVHASVTRPEESFTLPVAISPASSHQTWTSTSRSSESKVASVTRPFAGKRFEPSPRPSGIARNEAAADLSVSRQSAACAVEPTAKRRGLRQTRTQPHSSEKVR